MSRIARLVDRNSDQVVREFVLDGLTKSEVESWYLSLAATWDLVRFRLSWPNDLLEESDV